MDKAMSIRSQRGRAAQKKRGSSMGIFYVVLAVIAIAGVALLATANQRSSADTSSRPPCARFYATQNPEYPLPCGA
jgi:hypothetical protein